MKKIMLATVIFFMACTAFAGNGKLQPLNVKTGLWQIIEKITWTGLPPQAMRSAPPTTTYKSCVREKDLSGNPWAEGSGEKCSWRVVNSTGSDMELRGTSCNMGTEYGMAADVHGKIHVQDSEHGTGSMDVTLTGNGQTMHGHADYTGKWIAASCPAGVN